MIVRGSVAAYGLALGVVAAAVGGRLLLDPLLGDRLPFITLFVAIVFMAWQGGRGPALLTLVVGLGAAAFFLLHPRYSFAIDQFAYQVGLVFYAVIGYASIAMFEASARKQRRLEEEVAARQATEKVLAEREEFLRVTLASIGDGVITTDPNGNVISLNGVAQELTGWAQDEAHGQPLTAVFKIINEESRRPVENPVEKALREGRVVGLANHTLLVRKDGTERPIDDSAAPIRDDKGQIVGVVLIFRDISERWDTEKQLRESERELADFFENATVGLHWVGPDGTILRANQAELDMLGYNRDEYVGRLISDFHADAEVISDILKRLQAGEKLAEYPARLRCKDGSIKEVLIDSSVLFVEGRFVHTRCFTRDVTERKQAEANVRAQEQRMRLATQATSVGIWEWKSPARSTGMPRCFGSTALPRRLMGRSPTKRGGAPFSPTNWGNRRRFCKIRFAVAVTATATSGSGGRTTGNAATFNPWKRSVPTNTAGPNGSSARIWTLPTVENTRRFSPVRSECWNCSCMASRSPTCSTRFARSWKGKAISNSSPRCCSLTKMASACAPLPVGECRPTTHGQWMVW